VDEDLVTDGEAMVSHAAAGQGRTVDQAEHVLLEGPVVLQEMAAEVGEGLAGGVEGGAHGGTLDLDAVCADGRLQDGRQLEDDAHSTTAAVTE
jgi:hypothetical protein